MNKNIEKLLFSGNVDDLLIGCILLSKYSYIEIVEWYTTKINKIDINLNCVNNGYFVTCNKGNINLIQIKIKNNLFLVTNHYLFCLFSAPYIYVTKQYTI